MADIFMSYASDDREQKQLQKHSKSRVGLYGGIGKFLPVKPSQGTKEILQPPPRLKQNTFATLSEAIYEIWRSFQVHMVRLSVPLRMLMMTLVPVTVLFGMMRAHANGCTEEAKVRIALISAYGSHSSKQPVLENEGQFAIDYAEIMGQDMSNGLLRSPPKVIIW